MAEVGDISVHDVHTVEAGFDDFPDGKSPFVSVSLRLDLRTLQSARVALMFPADRKDFAAKLVAAINAVCSEDRKAPEAQGDPRAPSQGVG